MSHQIEKYDLTLSQQSAEWHGMATVIPDFADMLKTAKENLTFPILEAPAVVCIDGVTTPLVDEEGKGWKVIMADCRAMPIHAGRETHPPAFVPLHVPKQGYNPLENLRFLEALEVAMGSLGLPFNLSTAGTLANLAMFYFSLDLGVSMKGGRGESIKPYLSGVTSHNGFYTPTYKDTYIRPVCANTVSALMRELSNLTIVGKHTPNGLDSIENMGQAVEAFFKGIGEVEKVFARLQSMPATSIEMRSIVAGYFVEPALANERLNLDKHKLSKQAQNACEGVVELARTGRGNKGETLYDLFNGGTDYWSNGDGAGSNQIGLSKKAYRSNFGSASQHKTAFASYLMDDTRRAVGMDAGGRVLRNMAIAE